MPYWVSELMAWVLGILGGCLVAWPFLRLGYFHFRHKQKISGRKLGLAYLVSAVIFSVVYLALFRIDRHFLYGPMYDAIHLPLGNFLFGGALFVWVGYPLVIIIRLWKRLHGLKRLPIVILAVGLLIISTATFFVLAVKFSGPSIFWAYN